jgi:hypothetical protein
MLSCACPNHPHSFSTPSLIAFLSFSQSFVCVCVCVCVCV